MTLPLCCWVADFFCPRTSCTNPCLDDASVCVGEAVGAAVGEVVVLVGDAVGVTVGAAEGLLLGSRSVPMWVLRLALQKVLLLGAQWESP